MSKSITIKYLPNGTTQDEIKAMRNEFKKTHSEDCKLILYISGQANIKDTLQNFLSARKI